MNSVEISFLGVQPLQINYDVYSKILTSKTSFSNVNKYINTKNEKISNLEWFKNYNNLYESYHMLREWLGERIEHLCFFGVEVVNLGNKERLERTFNSFID